MAPPPPETPSPHRFLPGQRKTKPTPGEDRPPSVLRNQIAHAETRDSSSGPSSQFAAPPRFSSNRPRAAFSSRPASPPRATLVQALRTTARSNEDVIDPGTEDEDHEMLDNALPTVEGGDATNLQRTNDLALSPKRRRLNDDGASSDLGTGLNHFTTPSQLPHPTESSTAQRPAFIRPAQQSQGTSEPLPELFSPHRRGHKFVPGGMAATVQQWVLETGQAAMQSRKGQGYLHGEDYVMRVRIDGTTQIAGPYIARAKVSNGDSVDLFLAGAKDMNGSRSNVVKNETVIGIRAPTWEIELDGKTWLVGVDWRVLS